jgi:predicted small lipoprotein YifL
MKKLTILMLILALVCTIAACGETTEPVNPDPNDTTTSTTTTTASTPAQSGTHTVTFINSDSAGKTENVKVEHGEYAIFPLMPKPSDINFYFIGWFTDVELTAQFNELTPITSDLTLYGSWGENPTALPDH